MPHEEPTIQDLPARDRPAQNIPGRDAPGQDTAVQAPHPSAYEPAIAQEDEWLQEDEELPRRPRRRLLSPVPLALLGVLLVACGFIGGVLVEKGQSSSTGSAAGASGLAARFAALRGAGTGASTGASGAAGAGAFAGRAGAAAGGFGGATSGSVAYLAGSTLYVTTTEGNTVKITTSPATTVTKTVKSSVSTIRPGETVTATGATGASGAVAAESIRVGAGAGAGALFSGSGAGGGAQQSGKWAAEAANRPCSAGASKHSRADVRPNARSSTKELHASHQPNQPRLHGNGDSRRCPAARQSGPRGLRRILEQLIHEHERGGHERDRCDGRHGTRGGTLRGVARMPSEERHNAAQTNPGSASAGRRRGRLPRRRRRRPAPAPRRDPRAVRSRREEVRRCRFHRRGRPRSTVRQQSRRSRSSRRACAKTASTFRNRTRPGGPIFNTKGLEHRKCAVQSRRGQVPKRPSRRLSAWTRRQAAGSARRSGGRIGRSDGAAPVEARPTPTRARSLPGGHRVRRLRGPQAGPRSSATSG